MIELIENLTFDELTAAIEARRRLPLTLSGEAHFSARSKLAETDRDRGYLDASLVHINGILRAQARGGRFDPLAIATLMSVVEEFTAGLLAKEVIDPKHFRALVGPLAENAASLSWALTDEATPERIKEELDKSLAVVPAKGAPLYKMKSTIAPSPMPSDVRERLRANRSHRPSAGGGRAKKSKTVMGMDVDSLRAMLADSEESDKAAIAEAQADEEELETVDGPQSCSNCGDEVVTVSSRGWCDGCEAEDDGGDGRELTLEERNALTAAALDRIAQEPVPVEGLEDAPAYVPGGADRSRGWTNPKAHPMTAPAPPTTPQTTPAPAITPEPVREPVAAGVGASQIDFSLELD